MAHRQRMIPAIASQFREKSNAGFPTGAQGGPAATEMDSKVLPLSGDCFGYDRIVASQ
jgi:hypothetical protein